MKVLVTGGAGYIGSHTLLSLIENGHDVVVVDNFSNSSLESIRRVEKLAKYQVPVYELDIKDSSGLDAIFKKENVDAVIHFAALKAVGESTQIPLEYYMNNVSGTLNLLKVMRDNNVSNFVFSSSATVYGMPKSNPILEDFPLSTTNPYGATKLMVENILKDFSVANPNWNIVILRYFNPIGAHESGMIGEDPNGIPNNLVPYIAQVAVGKRDKLNIFGNDYATHDGTGVRDYIHVVDLAIGHALALKRFESNTGLSIYNLGTGTGYSVLDVVKAYEKASGVTIPYEISARRPGDIDACYANAEKAKVELGWEAKRDIYAMCEDSYRWQSSNPNGYKD